MTSSIDVFVTQQNVYRSANGLPLEYNATTGTVPVGGNGVVGFENYAFTSGAGTVLLDGPRANYAIQVASDGTTTIKDIGAGDVTFGQTITVTGENYIVFNGSNLAASTVITGGAATYPNDMYFVETQVNAQVAEFYAAMLQRQPDLGGLEYWEHLAATSGGVVGVAENFISYIHSTYSTSSPVTTLGGDPNTMTPTQYVTALYQNILDRAPDASGQAFWVNQMNVWTSQYGLAQAQADLLVSFTNATALTAAINATAGATPGSDTGWLINYSLTGGLADTGLKESATAVLTNGSATGYIDTNLIDLSTVTINPTNVGSTSVYQYNSSYYIGSVAANSTIVLSSSFTNASVGGNNTAVLAPSSGHAYIALLGNNDTASLSGNDNVVAIGSSASGAQTGENITGFNSTDSVHLKLSQQVASILTPVSQIGGSSLNFGTPNTGEFTYVVALGNVGGGTAAEMAAAADRLYVPTGLAGENIIFMGSTSTNDTVLAYWGTWGSVSQGNANTGDVNGNHLVDANEFTAIVTLVGVQANTLTTANFHQ